MMRSLTAGASCAALLAFAASAPAAAQDRSYEPLGVRAGSFLAFPRLRVGVALDDNVFADENDEQEDIIATIRPEVTLRSQFSRHELVADARAEVGIHADFDDEDYADYFFGLNGRIDVTRASRIVLGADYAREHEGRGTPDSANPTVQTELTEFDRYRGRLGVEQDFNRFSLGLLGGWTALDYDDAGAVNNDDRDRTRFDVALRAGFDVSPDIETYVEGVYDVVDYDDDVDDNGVNRDSDGFGARIGAEVALTRVLDGDVYLGYTFRDYDDAALEELDGIGFGGGLTWRPTGLTTVRLDLDRSINETTVGGASGNFETSISAGIEHRLRRNLILAADLGYTNDDFDGSGRDDDIIDAGAGLTYLLNRNFGFEAGYEFTDRSSSAAGLDFTRNVFRVGLVGQL